MIETNCEGIVFYQTRLEAVGQETGSRAQMIRWRAVECVEYDIVQSGLDEGAVLVRCAVLPLRKSSHVADAP